MGGRVKGERRNKLKKRNPISFHRKAESDIKRFFSGPQLGKMRERLDSLQLRRRGPAIKRVDAKGRNIRKKAEICRQMGGTSTEIHDKTFPPRGVTKKL